MRLSTLGTQPPSQAGRFYEAAPRRLAAEVDRLVGEARVEALPGAKAVIAPHAGYLYSGPIAGSAFATWVGSGGRITRVVLVGPSHHVDFHGAALPAASALSTPLGTVPIDLQAAEQLCRLPGVRVLAEAHAREHALEVELPFLQRVLGEFQVVPLVLGRAGDDEVAAWLEAVWGGPETRFVISSDLSHYLDYETARQVDGRTAAAVEAGEGRRLDGMCACGYKAIRGFLQLAAARGLAAETLDLRNSGDTAGPRDRVVGYGAFRWPAAEAGAGGSGV